MISPLYYLLIFIQNFFPSLFISASWLLRALLCFCSFGIKSGVTYIFLSFVLITKLSSAVSKQQSFSCSEATVSLNSLGLDPLLESCFLPIRIAFVIVALTPKCLVKTDEMVLVTFLAIFKCRFLYIVYYNIATSLTSLFFFI